MRKITLLFALLITSIGFSQNLITNGDFENGATGWIGGALNVVTENGNSYTSANVVTAANPWDANVSYVLTLEKDKTYKLTYDAWSDNGRTIIAGFGQNHDPWVAHTEVTAIATTVTTYTFTAKFTSDTDANARVLFDMGDQVGFIGIDNVMLEEVAEATAGQEVVQDFENGGLGGVFGASAASIVADPETAGTRGNVAMLSSNSGGEVWQGVNVELLKNVQLTTDKTMMMDVYSTSAITIAPKLVSGADGAPDSTTSVSHTGSGWETLTFTFDQGLDNTVAANGVYGAFVVYYNWDLGTGGYGTQDSRVFYIDNIKGNAVDAPAGATPPTTAAPTPPTRNAWDVISLYSDAYTNAASNFDAGWCGAGSIEEIEIAGNKTQAYKANACQGIVLDTGVDATVFTHMHVDVYIADGTDVTSSVFNLKFVNQPGGAAKEYNFNAASAPALEAGKWISIDVAVDLSTMTGFKEFGITSNVNGKLWYDNLYAYRAATASVDNNALLGFSMYPNPASNLLNISAKETIQNADVFNVLGKKVMSVNVNNTNASLDISNLASGIYLVKYNVGNTTGTAKFIKQ